MADAYTRALGKSIPTGLLQAWRNEPRMAAIGGLLMGDTKPAKDILLKKEYLSPEQVKQDAYQMAMDFNNPMQMAGLLGHTVWHGSPHKFDKFDMSKIGTGEGAQAYGHGLYFAESPEVAQTYADSLGATQFYANGAPLSGDSAWAAMHMADNGGNVKGILDWAKSSLKPTPEGRKAAASLVREARKLRGKEITEADGQVYKVDIPDEILPRMLDWDKPLSQQHPDVQNAFNNLGRSQNVNISGINTRKILDRINSVGDSDGFQVVSRDGKFHAIDNNAGEYKTFGSKNEAIDWLNPRISAYTKDDPSGANIYRDLVNNFGGADAISQTQVSNLLNSHGIPGIRYLDGNSRGTGGTSNFVLFDDQLPRIIERNGVPTGQQPWRPDELRGLFGGF